MLLQNQRQKRFLKTSDECDDQQWTTTVRESGVSFFFFQFPIIFFFVVNAIGEPSRSSKS